MGCLLSLARKQGGKNISLGNNQIDCKMLKDDNFSDETCNINFTHDFAVFL